MLFPSFARVPERRHHVDFHEVTSLFVANSAGVHVVRRNEPRTCVKKLIRVNVREMKLRTNERPDHQNHTGYNETKQGKTSPIGAVSQTRGIEIEKCRLLTDLNHL